MHLFAILVSLLACAGLALAQTRAIDLPNGAGRASVNSVDVDRPAGFAFTKLSFVSLTSVTYKGRNYALPLGGLSYTASNTGSKDIAFRIMYQPAKYPGFCQLPNIVLKRLSNGTLIEPPGLKFINVNSTCYFRYATRDQSALDRSATANVIKDIVFLAIPPASTTSKPQTGTVTVTAAPTTVAATTTKAATTAAPTTAAPTTTPSGDRFDVTFTFVGAAPSSTFRNTVTQAGQFLSNLIASGLPDINGVDDLAITINLTTIDGPSNVLGLAGPRNLRPGSRLPYTGFAWIDVDDQNNSGLLAILCHEFLHVLGIGTLWGSSLFNFVRPGTPNNLYVGANGLAQYRTLFATPAATGVPLENGGGSGTSDSHWEEDVFRNELMTGFLNAGANPISTVSIGALQDLGYSVNYNAATYVRPSGIQQLVSEADLSGKILAVSDQIIIG